MEDSGNKILVAVPRKEGKIPKKKLVKQGREVSRKGGFRFNLGEAVSYGYSHATNLQVKAPALKDKKPKK